MFYRFILLRSRLDLENPASSLLFLGFTIFFVYKSISIKEKRINSIIYAVLFFIGFIIAAISSDLKLV